MRIYAFAEHYPSPVKPYLDAQFEQLLRDGHNLRVFAFDRHRGALDDKVVRLGLAALTAYLPATLNTLPRHGWRALSACSRQPAARVRAALRTHDGALPLKRNLLNLVRMLRLPLEAPDLCLVHNLLAQRHLGFLRALYPGVPVAFYYHGGEVAGVPEMPPAEAARAFAGADIVFTNTENARAHAIGRGCPPEKLVVNPVGFCLDEFRPREQRDYCRGDQLRLLSIGRLSEEKGQIYALQALRRLQGQGIVDWRYRIVGAGPLEARLRAYVADNGLGEHVTFLGQLPRSALFAELESADVLLLPSIVHGTWQENQACVVQEAMLMKTLAVTTHAGGLPESIPPEMLPLCVPPEDPVALADALLSLLDLAPEDWVYLGERCRHFARERYDIARLNRRLLAACFADGPVALAELAELEVESA